MNNLIYKQYYYMKNVEPKDFSVSPYDVNYNLHGLHKKRFFNKGELNKINYYGYVDSGGTYQDLILTEHREYYRKDEMVFKRKLSIEWYLEDGSIGANKTTNKYYSPEESIKLGERRRRNIISNLKIETVGLIQIISGLTLVEASIKGLVFLGEVNDEISRYIEGQEDPLKNILMTLNNEDCAWLNAEIPNINGITIRMYLYDSIDIDYSDKLE